MVSVMITKWYQWRKAFNGFPRDFPRDHEGEPQAVDAGKRLVRKRLDRDGLGHARIDHQGAWVLHARADLVLLAFVHRRHG